MVADAETYVYLFCDDVEAVRAFYSHLLGLVEVDDPADEGSVTYRAGGLELVVTRHPEAVPSTVGWSVAPWGATPRVVASVPLAADAFRSALDRLLAAGAPRFADHPRRDHRWRFPVMDPMGNPIEITCAAGADLPLPAWPEDVAEAVAVGAE